MEEERRPVLMGLNLVRVLLGTSIHDVFTAPELAARVRVCFGSCSACVLMQLLDRRLSIRDFLTFSNSGIRVGGIARMLLDFFVIFFFFSLLRKISFSMGI